MKVIFDYFFAIINLAFPKTADVGSTTFNTEEKAILLMRNIRKHIVRSEAVIIGQDNNST